MKPMRKERTAPAQYGEADADNGLADAEETSALQSCQTSGLACFKKDLKRYMLLMPKKSLKSKVRLWLYTPGLWILFWYRLGRSLRRISREWRICKPGLTVYEFFYFVLRVLTGIDIPLEAVIGEGLYIGHYGGIIVHPDSHLGKNCNISQGVTIGEAGRGSRRGIPRIGERVYIGPGAKIFGAITIGDDVAIGANAVVNSSVPDGAVVGGIPARIISDVGSEDFVVIDKDAAPKERD